MISDLRERFGRASMSLLPAAGPTSPSASERSACHAFVLLQWVALYKGVVALGKPPDAIHSSDPPGAGMSELFHTSGSLRFSRKPEMIFALTCESNWLQSTKPGTNNSTAHLNY